jgi:integrase
MAARAPKGEVVRNPVRGGFKYALRFTAYGKRRYVTLGRPQEGWTEAKAQTTLDDVLADVRRGIWQSDVVQLAAEPVPEPTFHEFASAWFEATKGEWTENTQADYEWQLRVHLLPFFKDHRLSQITVAEVDRYREAKLAEGRTIAAAAKRGKPRMQTYTDRRGRKCKRAERPLSAVSINKTITRLGQVLEVAVERDLIPRNTARVGGKRRRLKAAKPRRTYLDRAEQVTTLLDAAGELDRGAPSNRRHVKRRAMLAVLAFAGLGIGELCALRWRHVDLAGGWLHTGSKTDAGYRTVKIRRALRDELLTLRASHQAIDQGAYVFPTSRGGRMSDDNFRGRVLKAAVKRASENLEGAELPPLPSGLTPHSLRRTFCSLLYALGEDPGVVMDEMGHADPALALRVYRQSMRRGEDEKAALRALAEGDYLAVDGSRTEIQDVSHADREAA